MQKRRVSIVQSISRCVAAAVGMGFVPPPVLRLTCLHVIMVERIQLKFIMAGDA